MASLDTIPAEYVLKVDAEELRFLSRVLLHVDGRMPDEVRGLIPYEKQRRLTDLLKHYGEVYHRPGKMYVCNCRG